MSSTTMSIRLDSDERDLFRAYAKTHGCSMSELMRRSTLEAIEDEADLADLRAARDADAGETFSLDEVSHMLGLS
jgi:predicted transcriptional regulator